KQKTAYDITTGDWSSDVCSSDLSANTTRASTGSTTVPRRCTTTSERHGPVRSEERRVGKECRLLCRYRWARDHEKKKKSVTKSVENAVIRHFNNKNSKNK